MSATIVPKLKRAKKQNPWTRDVLIKFFEVFEQYPCLYDTKSNFYSNKHARSDALSKIVEYLNVGITIEEVKTKINNIRTQLSHETKKLRDKPSGVGTDEVSEPVWWYDNVQFLIPHLKPRKSKDSFDLEQESQESCDEEVDFDELQNMVSASNMTPRACTSTSSGRKRDRGSDNFSYTETLETLKILNGRIVNSSNIGQKEAREAVFGTYVAQELSKIDDAEILWDAKHEINNILYKYSKMYAQSQLTTIEVISNQSYSNSCRFIVR